MSVIASTPATAGRAGEAAPRPDSAPVLLRDRVAAAAYLVMLATVLGGVALAALAVVR